MIQDILSVTLLTLGALLILLASIGIFRLPDVFLRMSASSKAATLGVILLMFGVAANFANSGVTARAIGIVLLMILTGPVSAHMIARAAYITGTPLWEHTRLDELAGQYDAESHALGHEPPVESPELP